jgi:hypothetical protein
MNINALEKEIGRGKELFTEIALVTADFLERFGCLELFEISEFESKRQALLDALVGFHSELKQKLSIEENDLPMAMTKQLEAFRIFQEVFIQIIMEKDAAIISQANRSCERLRVELAVVGRGKQALRGYNRRKSLSPNCLDESA